LDQRAFARFCLSGPILFTATGLFTGPLGLDLLRIDITGTELKVLPEASLAMVLFTDAAHADLGVVRRTVTLRPRGAAR
jgi:NhaP-type Na+/H+ or K+/H+ antiporter